MGQEIAAVAAETQAQADAAVQAIEVSVTQKSPSVYPEDAMLPDASPVWAKDERGQASNAQEAPGMPNWLFNGRVMFVVRCVGDLKKTIKAIDSLKK